MLVPCKRTVISEVVERLCLELLDFIHSSFHAGWMLSSPTFPLLYVCPCVMLRGIRTPFYLLGSDVSQHARWKTAVVPKI